MPVVEDWKPYTVSTKVNWSDPWTAQPFLICNRLTRAAMPTIDSASFLWRSGDILQPGESTFENYPRLDIGNNYVRIESPALLIDWIGYVVADNIGRNAAKDDNGNLRLESETPSYTAVGLEWFLSRVQVDSSVFYKDDDNHDRIQRPVGYNMGMGSGRSVSYASRGNKDTRTSADQSVFAQDSDNAEPWDAFQIVENLLFFHGPRDENGDPGPVKFNASSASSANLAWYSPQVPTEGRSVLDVLGQVIDKNRGLVWWTKYDDLDDSISVVVSSGSPSAVALPSGATLPQAGNLVTYDFDDDIAVASSSVGRDASRRYDRVKVRGARRRTVMTVSVADGNLEESWKPEEETAYKDAEGTDAEKNDRFRKASRFERVYQAFRIPEDWDGKAGDGKGGTKDYVSPLLPPGSVSVIDGEPFHLHGLRFLRNTPLKAGFDYTDATNATSNLPAKTQPDFLRPFCLVKHGEKFVFGDRSANHIDEDDSSTERLKSSYQLIPLTDEPGFQVRSTGMPHALAEGHFDGAAESKVEPEIDYANILFTTAVEWDSYCEGAWPEVVPTASPVQELVIYLGNGLRLDWLAQQTVFDIDESGDVRTVGTGGPIQDDRQVCEDIARVAYEWYSTPRSTLEVSLKNLQAPVAIGDLITKIGTAGENYELTINATATQITHDLEKGTTSISAGYSELDFGGLV